MEKEITLPWSFEHFKTFTPYEIMQQAASTLLLFEGEGTDGKNLKMNELTELLISRTGHKAWVPNRDNGNLNINSEGSVFRNKARVFSSMYIIYPLSLLEAGGYGKKIVLTNFGRMLATGKVSKSDFYKFIISQYHYPHAAFDDYENWVLSGKKLYPFKLILKVLLYLFKKEGYCAAYLTENEVYTYLKCTLSQKAEDIGTKILKDRSEPKPRTSSSSINKDDLRNIKDILSFLCIGEYLILDANSTENKYWLNLCRKHPLEKTLFYLSRTASGGGMGKRSQKYDIVKELEELCKGD